MVRWGIRYLPPVSNTVPDNIFSDACLEDTYELLKESRLRTPSGSGLTSAEDEQSEGDLNAGVNEEAAEDTFKLTLRSVKTPRGIVLTVRPQTKCGAIVEAFLRKASLTNQSLERNSGITGDENRGKRSVATTSGPWLVVDGDKLGNEVEIGEAEVEDGDIIEVTGV